jgi:hypothetical protein
MKERIMGRARSRSLCEDVFYLGECISRRHREVSSASRVVCAGKPILRRFLQRFICKVMVFPRRPRIEDQEVNNIDRIIFDVNALAVPRVVRNVP